MTEEPDFKETPRKRCSDKEPHVGHLWESDDGLVFCPGVRDRTGKFGTGWPGTAKLDLFGELVHDAWGHIAYLVGSATTTKTEWRDVDIRLILPDDEYEALFLHPTVARPQRFDYKWRAHCIAWSELGRQMTGLPIDFQIQHMTMANQQEQTGPRMAIGLRLDRRQQFERDRVAKYGDDPANWPEHLRDDE